MSELEPPGARPASPAGAKPALPPGAGKKPALPPGAGKKPALPPGAGKKPALLPGAGKAAGPALPPGGRKKPSRSKLETIKEASEGLRGNLAGALQESSDHFDEIEKQLLKFHGTYQQDDRDARQGGKAYSFMVRSKLPGGGLSAEQYLVHDDLADAYGNGTLRITTRQGFQLHGILKGDLRSTLRDLNHSLVTTLGACGDVVRNVMFSPVPPTRPYEREIVALARQISDHVLPRTRAYHEIWLEGEQIYDGKVHAEEEDPLYGRAFLPRKFKIGVAFPGDNSIDVYTQDVGLVAVAEGDRLAGFNVLVGGGLGMTHKKPDTFPRLADPLAFVTPDEVLAVVTEIIRVQRDHGDRTDRRHARLKYLIHDWGIDRFRGEVEDRLGYGLRPVVPTPPLELELYLGWHAQGDGRYFLGISIENGRIQDEGDVRLRTGLRAVVEQFRPGVSLTPSQDLLLTDVAETDRDAIDALLDAHGIRPAHALSNARKFAMACPALPTCGLAITESERVLPAVIDRLEAELAALGLQDETFTVRMTGCPNGCARPYVADVGFVGRSLDQYAVFLGGRSDGTRLNTPFKDLVPLAELVPTLRPLLVWFRQDRRAGERFGDFCHRVGNDALLAHVDAQAEAVEVQHA